MVALGETSISAAAVSHGLPIDIHAGYSSSFVVLNEEIQTDNPDAADPGLLLDGNGADNNNIRPLVVPNMGIALELRVLMQHSSAPINTVGGTNPVVHVYGKVPSKDVRAGRIYPEDVDPANYNHDIEGDGGFWVELYARTNALDALSSDTLLDCGTDSIQYTPATGAIYAVSRAASVMLTGVEQVMVAVETPAAGANFTRGMVIGRFIGPRST